MTLEVDATNEVDLVQETAASEWDAVVGGGDDKAQEETQAAAEQLEATAPPAPGDGGALAEIRDAREAVRRCQSVYLAKKEEAKEAKAAWEASVVELTATIDRVIRPLPLFDRLTEATAVVEECPRGGPHEPDEDGDCVKCGEPGVGPAPEGSEAWRSKRISEIGLSPKIIEILEGHNINTLADWVDLPRARGIEYTQLKGLTETRFEKISEAVIKVTT